MTTHQQPYLVIALTAERSRKDARILGAVAITVDPFTGAEVPV